MTVSQWFGLGAIVVGAAAVLVQVLQVASARRGLMRRWLHLETGVRRAAQRLRHRLRDERRRLREWLGFRVDGHMQTVTGAGSVAVGGTGKLSAKGRVGMPIDTSPALIAVLQSLSGDLDALAARAEETRHELADVRGVAHDALMRVRELEREGDDSLQWLGLGAALTLVAAVLQVFSLATS